MAKQLNLLNGGQVIPTALHQEMQRSYLEYAMSVIVGRALPDVRDGLKPVHRRILYAMYELGLTPDRPFRKCARVVGDVLGKYHPHGDQAVYDALVRMVQDFSSRYPLLLGHGNFGSVDNDPAAAMRYTETKLAEISYESLLREINEATVDFTDNFDNSQQEPVVLPAQLPNLLLNGCSGIAVGMATNIPPHNLGEVVDGLIALIDKPDLTDEKLGKIIPAPDFPTGGEIIDNEGIKNAYSQGKGLIRMRGIAKIETFYDGKKRKRKKTAIIVTELPYQVNKAAWIQKIADLVNQGKLTGISDIRDESDRAGMRVVIELKKDAKPQTVLDRLYKQTALSSNFGVIMLALVNNKPVQLSLRQLLAEFLQFREQTLRRRYTDELENAQQRLHIIQGLLTALKNLDQTINILRRAADGSTAKLHLQTELELSPNQAEAILAMPLRRLTALENQKLQTEATELQARINLLEKLLNNRHELLKALKRELRSLKRKFSDERRTKIIQLPTTAPPANSAVAKPAKSLNTVPVKPNKKNNLGLFKPVAEAEVKITQKGSVYWQNPHSESGLEPNDIIPPDEVIIQTEKIGKQAKFITITDKGKAYPVYLSDIPSEIHQPKPNILSFLSTSARRDVKKTVANFFLPKILENIYLILLTQQGKIKRLAWQELKELGNRGLSLINLKDNDRLIYVQQAKEDEQIVIATNKGRILRFQNNEAQMPVMGRTAQGNQALKLRYGESIVSCICTKPPASLVLITEQGYGKRLSLTDIRLGKRGDIGSNAIQFSSKEDNLLTILSPKSENQDIILLTNYR
ncbi:MAG: DNA topoisomerase 4 subunit A, partial [Cyanobacteria bacterium J083]